VSAILDAATRLGGRPVATVRFSLADPRLRHEGVSHHTTTALRLAPRSTIGVPRGPYEGRVRADLGEVADAHRLLAVDDPDVPALLALRHLHVTSMGRTAADDPGFYAVAGAAGTAAAALTLR